MDNEETIWYSTHRDVHPVGPTMQEILRQDFRLRRHGQGYRPQRAGLRAGGMGLVADIFTADMISNGLDSTVTYCRDPDRSTNGGWDYMPVAAQPTPSA